MALLNFRPCASVLRILVFSFILSAHSLSAPAQGGGREAKAAAQQLMREGDYEKALPILQHLYAAAPFDKSAYADYLKALIATKSYEQADSVVHFMMQIRRGDPALLIDLGRIATAAGHQKKAGKYYETAIDHLPANDFQVKALANAFSDAGLPDYAIQTYLKARAQQGSPYAFATELSLLYDQTGDRQAAIEALLDKAMTQVNIMDDLKEALIQVMSREKNGLKEIQKALNKRLKINPNNPIWQQLLSWTYTQDNDYAGALKNLKALDENFKEQGKRLMPFAYNATQAGQYDVALQAFDYIIDKGKGLPYYRTALAGRLHCNFKQLEEQRPPQTRPVQQLLSRFSTYFHDFPQDKNSDLWRKYALVEARYNNNPDTAILLLQQVTDDPTAGRDLQGRCKLDMGDYYLLSGKIWDATLLYSQVNKAFEQDELGELARFKNAKWAFYKGDFNLAQEQLSVLKASTSKLIANDALYLSVLITENTPPDSNMLPLQRYAAADLLLFKHQTQAAEQLLDSIATAWPQSPLQDDIAMLQGKTAAEAGDWHKAVQYYKIVLEQYGTDVLGDDAAWSLAELYRKQLKDNEKAAQYYQTLILQYPGSTFVQQARKQYRELSAATSRTSGT